jgi:cytochrome c oxidase cbb3-type subunit 3
LLKSNVPLRVVVGVAALVLITVLSARVPASAGGQAYPPRPPVEPAILERGKAIYSVNCAFCHGADARGGDGGGPNLLRSQLVLSDQKGELVGEVIRNGRPGPPAMPPIALTDAQVSDVADYLHSFSVGGYDISRDIPKSIVVGDRTAGVAAFKARCASCHSITGDLKAIGARFADARALQDYWLVPSAAAGRGGRGAGPSLRPVTATVTLPSGERIEGRLIRIDDFIVTVAGADGMPRSFGRTGDTPKVEIADPLKPHRDLLPKYTDQEIHDITAYLVTVK